MAWHVAFGKRLAALLINVLFAQHITDLAHSAPRASKCCGNSRWKRRLSDGRSK
jgi:hypothetical protein